MSYCGPIEGKPDGQDSEDLLTRLVCAIVAELRETDSLVLIGIGEQELRVTWDRHHE